MKTNNIVYWVSTSLLCAFMLFSVGNYIFNSAYIVAAYVSLGFAPWVMVFNATAKVLGGFAIMLGKGALKEWAYAGYAYIFALAIMAHFIAGDNMWQGSAIAIVLLVVSYVSYTIKKRAN